MKLTKTQRLILKYLEDDQPAPSLFNLAITLGVDQKWLRELIYRLEAANLITVDRSRPWAGVIVRLAPAPAKDNRKTATDNRQTGGAING